MRFDDPEWPATPEGACALAAAKRLAGAMISEWPRRRQTLVEIGCGNGFFLQAFWEAGFDVAGVDSSPEALALARDRMGHKAELYRHAPDRLPFDENEFDFAALPWAWAQAFSPQTQARVLAEASRVARKGLLVGVLNRRSWAGFWERYVERPDNRADWRSLPAFKRQLRYSAGDYPIRGRSVLPGPRRSWRDAGLLGLMNRRTYPAWAGAYAIYAVDFTGDVGMTGILEPVWGRKAVEQ